MVKEDKKSKVWKIDDAIKHVEEVALACEVKSRDVSVPYPTRKIDEKVRDKHIQLAEWLKELKELRKERIELKKQNLILRFIVALYEEDDEPDWIPVEDELPEEDGRYLVSFKKYTGIPCKVDICNYGVMHFSDFDDIEKHWYFGYSDDDVCMDKEVAAWMKLPEVWKDGE